MAFGLNAVLGDGVLGSGFDLGAIEIGTVKVVLAFVAAAVGARVCFGEGFGLVLVEPKLGNAVLGATGGMNGALSAIG